MYADIIVDISHEQLDKAFQYRIPPELAEEVSVGVMVNVPFGRGNRIITGYVIDITDKNNFDADKIKDIESVVPNKVRAIAGMIKLADWLKRNYGGTMNQALKMVIPVKETVKIKEKHIVKRVISDEEARRYLEIFKRKNATARLRLLTALMQQEAIDLQLVKSKLNIALPTVKALEDMGILCIESEQMYRNPTRGLKMSDNRLELNEEQKCVVDSIINDYDSGIRKTYLIHGITGSGKTLCYIELIEHVLNKGKQVIVLIPEIALTFQTVQRFYQRFGEKVSILNSKMSKGERYDQFLRAMRQEISVIVGPRSALFTPFPNIGLIIIDEEHEGAYKSEQVPKYHARQTAVHIAKESNALVILGSATPSVESYYKAMNGEYKLFTLSKRASGGQLPDVYIEDLRKELKNGNRSIFSMHLQQLIQDRLNKKQQIMLFLNKRGYAGFISCRSCGYVIKCPHCDISMTEHRGGRLVCHYCGYETSFTHICPKCGSKYISGFRAGTQQVEDSIKKMYPYARVLRMDMDTTRLKGGHEKILSAFANHEADILIGTQMIVKGHDFADVTLVGILAADMSLYAGDYSAAERTFQLLTQAAGRAGRGDKKGEVVIQTYSPDNYSIVTAGHQDYLSFYKEEIEFRKLMGYPPVLNMLKVIFSSKNEDALNKAAKDMNGYKNKFKDSDSNIFIADVVNLPVYKLDDIYNKVLYAKSGKYEKLISIKDDIDSYVKENPVYSQVNVQFEFN